MSVSKLADFINARNLSGVALASHLTGAFADDAMHLVNANNSQPLTLAAQSLPMGKKAITGKQNQAIGAAIGHAVKAMADALPDGQGWIGAVHGAFGKAPKEARAPYLAAHAIGVAAFGQSLADSGEFTDKAPKTDAQKAAEKAEKEEKAQKAAAEQKAAVKAAMLASGEVIDPAAVRDIGQFSLFALAEHMAARVASGETLSDQTRAMLAAMLETAAA